MKLTSVRALAILLLAVSSCTEITGSGGVPEASEVSPTVTEVTGSGLSGSAGSSGAPETSGSGGEVAVANAAGKLQYCPPGDLAGTGEAGNPSRKVFFPNIRFPVEFAAATHMATGNSQMYNPGGYCSSGVCNGSDGGSSCVLSNFQPPWRDTFCEEAGRGYGTKMCPDGRGHQGLDIRPPVKVSGETNVCRRDHWFALAVADGQVTRASGAVVELVDRDGRRYVYRHLNPGSIRDVGLKRGDRVSAGQRLGKLDQFNNAGTKRYTTLHLHIEGLAVSSSGETIYYPLYTSIIAAYRKTIGLPSLVSGSFNLGVDGQREITGGCG